MRTLLAMLALALLPGCIARMLWPLRFRGDPPLMDRAIVERHEARFVVTAVGTVAPPAERRDLDGLDLAVRVHRVGGRWVDCLRDALGIDATFRFHFEDPGAAAAVAAMLTEQPLGLVDPSVFAIEWTRSPEGYQFWRGHVTLRGSFAAHWRTPECTDDEARMLLVATGARATDDVADVALQDAVAAARELDWRVLLPWVRDGRGEVLRCVPRGGADRDPDCGAVRADDVDLLVRVGDEAPHFLRVPAAVMPVFAVVRRDGDTLLDRFAFDAEAIVAPEPLPLTTLLPTTLPVHLQLVSRIEDTEAHYGAFARNVLMPIVDVIDGLLRFIERQLFRWPTPENEGRDPSRRQH